MVVCNLTRIGIRRAFPKNYLALAVRQHVLVDELGQCALGWLRVCDRIGFVLLNLGPVASPKIIWRSLYGSTRDAASSRSGLTLLLVPLS
jgi:hypothetical protein